MDEPTSSSSAAAIADNAATKKITDTTASLSSGSSGGGGDITKSKTSVTLLIKASNQQHDDQIIESDLLWTVKRLKKQISHCYPSKPLVAEQKLIYSGQLLSDKLQLKDVIRSYKDVYTHNHVFHLVCASKNLPLANLNQKPKIMTQVPQNMNAIASNTLRQRYSGNSEAQLQQVQQPEPQQQQQQQQQQPQQQNSLHQMQQLYPQYAQMFASHPSPYIAQLNYQAMATQQATMYMWMQQVYMDYMDQWQRVSTNSMNGEFGNMPTPVPQNANIASLNPYLQQFPFAATPNAAAAATAAAVNSVIAFPSAMAPPVVATEAPPAGVVQQQAQPAVDNQQEEPAVVAPRFPNIVQDEADNRDWLDRFFSVLRLAIFLTILFFHTSPLRCGIVVLIATGIYLYHVGILRWRRQERNNNNINRNNNAAEQIRQGVAEIQQAQQHQPEPEPDDGLNNNNNNNDNHPPAPNEIGNANENNTEHNNNNPSSIFSFVRTFVVTFFTSLLPEAPAM